MTRKNKMNYQNSTQKMDGARDNPAFIGDDNLTKSYPDTTSLEKSKDAFYLDIRDGKKALEANQHTYDTYDPFQHRNVSHPTTNSETLLHLLKGSLGTGILAMPLAFSNAGYVLGLIGTAVIGTICTYCVHLMISAEYELCKRNQVPSMTYPQLAEVAFATGPKFFKFCSKFIGVVVNVFLVIYQLGACVVYIVFVAQNIKAVGDEYTDDDISYELYVLMLLLPLILISWVRNLKYMAPFSTFANVVTLVSFGIIFYYLIRDGPTFEKREAVGEVGNWALFLGSVLFALEAIGVIMPLENEMKTPKSFGKPLGILNVAMFIIIGLYITMGLLGYLTYGEGVEDTITLNLNKDEVLAQVVKGTLALAIFITFGLQHYVAFDITWNMYLAKKVSKDSKMFIFWEYVVRSVLVLLAFGLAIAIPNLGLFISLFGAFCLSALGLAFPASIDLCTYWNSYSGKKFGFLLTKNIALIIFAIFGLIVGTGVSIRDIIKEFN